MLEDLKELKIEKKMFAIKFEPDKAITRRQTERVSPNAQKLNDP